MSCPDFRGKYFFHLSSLLKINITNLHSIQDILKEGDLDERSLMVGKGSLDELDLSLK